MIVPLSVLVGLLLSTTSSLLQSTGLGAIIPNLIIPRGLLADVTVEEKHSDELVVTENPVEQGAAVTDHAFKQPARLNLRLGYSNSSAAADGDPLYVQAVYALLLALQAARAPFGLITGKRIYTTLLITALETTTDEKWENAMMIEVGLKEIIQVQTQTVSVPPTQNMQAPGVTGATQNLGNQSLTPGTNFNSGAVPAVTQ